MKVFGREPAAIVGAVQALLALAVSFGWLEWALLDSQDDVAVVVGVTSAGFAVYLAWVTNETLLAPVVEVTKAVLALGAIYGLQVTTEQTGLLVAAITMLLALWQRGQVSPLAQPTFKYVAPGDTGAVAPRAGEAPPPTAYAGGGGVSRGTDVTYGAPGARGT